MLSSQNNQLIKLLTRIAVGISIVVGLSFPVAYTLIAHSDLSDSLTFKAKIKAHTQTELITTLPFTWMYAENRIQGLLKREPVVLENETIEVFDKHGERITALGAELTGPVMQRSFPLYDIDEVVGRVVISASLESIYKNIFWVSILGAVIGSVILFILRLLPIRALKRVSDELYLEKEQAVATLHSISDAVLVCDTKGNLVYFNFRAEKMLGRCLSEVKGQPISDFLHFTDKETGVVIESTLDLMLRNGSPSGNESLSILKVPGHHKITVEERATPIYDQAGEMKGGVLSLRDVTIALEYLERQAWEASHDSLTGLFNRREFEKRIATVINENLEQGSSSVVCFMDLDRFKVINDSCGHVAGDDVLKELTQLMRAKLRKSDTLARLGGDEFGLLLKDCSAEEGFAIASELLTAVEQYQFLWDKQMYTVGLSIGLTRVTENTFTFDEVLAQADSACYWAKDQGRQRICIYREDDNDLAARRRETSWVGRITSAIKEDRFVLYHQKYRPLSSDAGSKLHLEILLRMVAEDGEIISPARFLPSAERYNLVRDIDHWVINKALSDLKRLQDSYKDKELVININLSGASINSLDLLDFVKEKIMAYQVDPTCLCFEITETVAVNDMRSAIDFINACKEIGIKFAIDDFGTGASSFGYLKNLPIDYLKIDGSFVQNLEHDPIDRAMTETINRIGHIMGKITIAEYAENQTIISILEDIGVDFAQGYGVGKPMPLLASKVLDND